MTLPPACLADPAPAPASHLKGDYPDTLLGAKTALVDLKIDYLDFRAWSDSLETKEMTCRVSLKAQEK